MLTLKRVLGSRALTSIQRHGLAHSLELIPFYRHAFCVVCLLRLPADDVQNCAGCFLSKLLYIMSHAFYDMSWPKGLIFRSLSFEKERDGITHLSTCSQSGCFSTPPRIDVSANTHPLYRLLHACIVADIAARELIFCQLSSARP